MGVCSASLGLNRRQLDAIVPVLQRQGGLQRQPVRCRVVLQLDLARWLVLPALHRNTRQLD